ncbi:MAG: hypothetical protein ABS934_07725 [Psychrobacillus sp.]
MQKARNLAETDGNLAETHQNFAEMTLNLAEKGENLAESRKSCREEVKPCREGYKPCTNVHPLAVQQSTYQLADGERNCIFASFLMYRMVIYSFISIKALQYRKSSKRYAFSL